MNRVCLAWCFLPLSEESGKTCQMWNAFSEALARRGYDLILLSAESSGALTVPSIRVPVTLRDYTRELEPESFLTDVNPNEEVLELVAYDALWCSDGTAYDRREGVAGYRICEALARLLRKTLDPSLVLLWGSSLPQNTILQHLFLAHHVPVYVVERGLLPDTLMLERWGNGFQSDLIGNFMCWNSLRGGRGSEHYESAKRFYLESRPNKYPQADFVDPDSLRRKLGISPSHRVVTLFGQNDIAAGLVRATGSARLTSPMYESTLGAVKDLERAVSTLSAASERSDTVLLFKPHPDDRFDYEEYFGKGALRILRKTNVHSLFAMSDVIAAMISTVQFEALFHEKPVLLMGRSQLWGQGVAYEASEASDLATELNDALAKKGFDDRLLQAKRFVSSVLERFLFASEPGVPAEHGLDDLASFLSSVGTYGSSNLPTTTRLSRFRSEYSRLRTLGDWRSERIPHAPTRRSNSRPSPPSPIVPAENASQTLKKAIANLRAP